MIQIGEDMCVTETDEEKAAVEAASLKLKKIVEERNDENEVREYLAHIETETMRIAERADARILTEDEKKALREAVEDLRFAFDELDRCFIGPATSKNRGAGYLLLAKLISDSIVIGSLSLASKPAQRFKVFKGNKEYSEKKRPNAESLLTRLIIKKLQRNPEATNSEIKTAIIDEAENGADVFFGLEGDRENGAIVWVDERERLKAGEVLRKQHRHEIRDIGSAISKARKKFEKKNCR